MSRDGTGLPQAASAASLAAEKAAFSIVVVVVVVPAPCLRRIDMDFGFGFLNLSTIASVLFCSDPGSFTVAEKKLAVSTADTGTGNSRCVQP